jgi:spectinomycin phosphotransferase
VFQPPSNLTDTEVLNLVRSGWSETVDRIEHLAVGFGAHHWRAEQAGVPIWFVTYDRFGDRHTESSLAAAYAGAIELAARGLEFVLAPALASSGDVLLPVADGALSCTPWVDAEVVADGPLIDAATAAQNIADLTRLHTLARPEQIPRWKPLIAPDLDVRLSRVVAEPWQTGPYGESSRAVIAHSLTDVHAWTERYLQLAAEAVDRGWVLTHGETHTANQIRTADGIRFVDWESLKLAPRERDLSTLVQAGYGDQLGADRAMVELFDLEWRLSEIDAYATWFAAPHTGTTDDRVAYRGLQGELDRSPWWR